MPNRLPDTSIRIHDWPDFGKQTSISLDRRIVPNEQAVRDYCEQRFGSGALKPGVDHTYEYNRRQIAAPLLMSLFTCLLNKSY